MYRRMLIATAALLASGLVHAQSVAERQGLLADSAQRTLYTFDKDAPGKSNCYDACAAAWPPFYATEGEAKRAGFGVIVRDDGTRQWMLDGKPIYYFAADVRPGDAKGDGQGGVWHAIRVGAKAAPTAASEPGAGAYGYY